MLRTVEGGLRIVDEGVGRSVVLLHGFPDRAELWRDVSPHLQAGGLRTLALDLPGFGESPAPAGRAEYGVENVAGQVLGALDALGVSERVDVVGHDWGAVLGWVLCLRHPDRVRRFVALSVGHPRAYINAGLEQKRKGTYMLKWQIPRLAEHGLSEDDFRRLRAFMPRHPDIEQVVTDLRRPGRLTAGLNWYRANYLQNVFTRWPKSTTPTLGVWSSEDDYLAEDQMVNSRRYVTSDWRYERLDGIGHWIPLEAPEVTARLIQDWLATA
jgi:pimeloyl-ACP methyl ester carboxylesterase